MHVISGANNVDTILKMYDVVRRAQEFEIRGQKCREIEDLAVILDARVCPLTSFQARELNLNYAKKEWLWYLSGDKMDDSIMEHAKMWQKLKQPDGSFYSNYGQYIFGKDPSDSPFSYVGKTLIADPQSRRACMMFLQPEHLFESNVDVVCTYGIRFSIRNNYLNMTVMMRSNDVIFGFTNDAFCFWNVYMFMYTLLQSKMPELMIGSYTHFTNSMHVYERHYTMIKDLVTDGSQGYIRTKVPTPTLADVKILIASGGQDGSDEPYSTWLKA